MKLTANRCGRSFWPIRANHKPIHFCHCRVQVQRAYFVHYTCAYALAESKIQDMCRASGRRTRRQPQRLQKPNRHAKTVSIFNFKREIMHFISRSSCIARVFADCQRPTAPPLKLRLCSLCLITRLSSVQRMSRQWECEPFFFAPFLF